MVRNCDCPVDSVASALVLQAPEADTYLARHRTSPSRVCNGRARSSGHLGTWAGRLAVLLVAWVRGAPPHQIQGPRHCRPWQNGDCMYLSSPCSSAESHERVEEVSDWWTLKGVESLELGGVLCDLGPLTIVVL